MSKSYTSLKLALVTALTAIKGQDNNALFTSVETVEETALIGNPSAFVVENLGEGSILSTAQNEREWRFDIHIIYGQSGANKTPENVSEALLDAVDRVITYFDQNPQFKDGNHQAQAKYVKVVPLEFNWANREYPQVRAILRVAIVDTVNRFSN